MKFQYKVDWFNTFEDNLQKIRELEKKEYLNKSIKTNIIESNQTLIDLEKYWNLYSKYNKIAKINVEPSKEKDFFNIILQTEKNSVKKEYYLYAIIDEKNPRFWTVFNQEDQSEISPWIEKIFTNFDKQDSIYLSNNMMRGILSRDNIIPGGFSINFSQKFGTLEDIPLDDESMGDLEEEENEEENEDLEIIEGQPKININEKRKTSIFKKNGEDLDASYTMRLWTANQNSFKKTLDSLLNAGLPIAIKSYMGYFKDEDDIPILKEEYDYKGKFTINSGKDFRKHLDFVSNVKNSYSVIMTNIEDFRFNQNIHKGDLICIQFNIEIFRKKFIQLINSNTNTFKMYFTPLYYESNYDYYRVSDLHNGDHFYCQLYDDRVYLNLHKNCCGNNVFRLFTNLQKYLYPNLSISINNQVINQI